MENPFEYHALASMRDIKQYSDIDCYYSYFDLLRVLSLWQFPGICDAYFLSRFINGLKLEIQVYVLQHHHSNLLDAYELALIQEYILNGAHKLQSTIEKPSVQVGLSDEAADESFLRSITDSIVANVDGTSAPVDDFIAESPLAMYNAPVISASVEDVAGSVAMPVTSILHNVFSAVENSHASTIDAGSEAHLNMNSVGTTYTNPDFLVAFSFLEHEKTIPLSAYVWALPLQDSRMVGRAYVVLMQEFIIMHIPYILVTCVGTPVAIPVIEFHWCLGRYAHRLFLCCTASKAGIILFYALTDSLLVHDKALLSCLSRLCNNVVLNPLWFMAIISTLHPITSVCNVDILVLKSLLLLVPLLGDILTTSSLVVIEVSHSVGNSLFAKQGIVLAAKCGTLGAIMDKEGTITPMLKQMVDDVLESATNATRNIASPNYTVIYGRLTVYQGRSAYILHTKSVTIVIIWQIFLGALSYCCKLSKCDCSFSLGLSTGFPWHMDAISFTLMLVFPPMYIWLGFQGMPRQVGTSIICFQQYSLCDWLPTLVLPFQNVVGVYLITAPGGAPAISRVTGGTRVATVSMTFSPYTGPIASSMLTYIMDARSVTSASILHSSLDISIVCDSMDTSDCLGRKDNESVEDISSVPDDVVVATTIRVGDLFQGSDSRNFKSDDHGLESGSQEKDYSSFEVSSGSCLALFTGAGITKCIISYIQNGNFIRLFADIFKLHGNKFPVYMEGSMQLFLSIVASQFALPPSVATTTKVAASSGDWQQFLPTLAATSVPLFSGPKRPAGIVLQNSACIVDVLILPHLCVLKYISKAMELDSPLAVKGSFLRSFEGPPPMRHFTVDDTTITFVTTTSVLNVMAGASTKPCQSLLGEAEWTPIIFHTPQSSAGVSKNNLSDCINFVAVEVSFTRFSTAKAILALVCRMSRKNLSNLLLFSLVSSGNLLSCDGKLFSKPICVSITMAYPLVMFLWLIAWSTNLVIGPFHCNINLAISSRVLVAIGSILLQSSQLSNIGLDISAVPPTHLAITTVQDHVVVAFNTGFAIQSSFAVFF